MTDSISQLHQQAQIALNNQEYQRAHQLVIAILTQDKYFADGYFLLAMIASHHHNHLKAIQLIEQATKLAPDNAEYFAQLAKHYALENDHINAICAAEKAAQLSPESALTLDTLGVAYSQIGLHQNALPFFEKAVKNQVDNPSFQFNLASCLKFVGDFERARDAFEKTVSLAPHFCKAHAAISSLGSISPQNNHIERLEGVYQQVSSSDDKLHIGHALAREYESLGDYDKAFSVLNDVKQNKLRSINYQFAEDRAMFESLIAMFSGAEQLSDGFESDEPIFVVGMPRTGTTLVERIISHHTDVTTAGELQHFGLLYKKLAATKSNKVIDKETVAAATNIDFYKLGKGYIDSTRAITGKTLHFVDKMPLNVLYAGFICQALPKAKIICLDRHPLDTIVSNFRQLFAVNFSYYNYAYSLESTAEFYLLFKGLIAFWQKRFPDNFKVVNYEQLVNEPEKHAKALIEFAGLTWQPECLNIHENVAPVATASAVQVRSPISNKSVGNWKKYEPYLSGVKEILRQAGINL